MPAQTEPNATTQLASFPQAVVLLPASDAAAIGFCKSILAKTDPTKNADFNPTPQELATLATDTAAYDTAYAKSRGGGRAATQALKAARKKIMTDLSHVRDRVQQVAETKTTPADAAAVIVGAGLSVKKRTKRNKPPVRAVQGPTSGTAWLELLRLAKVATYFWVFSTDQKNWSSAPETMKAKLLLTGLTAGQTYYFKFRALTPKGMGDTSDPRAELVPARTPNTRGEVPPSAISAVGKASETVNSVCVTART